MAIQYWVGDFFVDLSRNQVTQKEYSQTIAPKALAVLTYLAENQGRVVSYDELFSRVWPDTIVSPNTLQKSIAQLRKVLDQDSKLQPYIKTHAKQGYSLECDVQWHDLPDKKPKNTHAALSMVNPNINTINGSVADEPYWHKKAQTNLDNTKPKNLVRLSIKLVAVFVGIAILGFMVFNYLAPTQPSKLSFVELRSLTATDNKEYSAIYSPNGEYIVFQRYSELSCSNHIWAKNTNTQKETQLTKNLGSFGSHSFSKDGKELVFIEAEKCDKPVTQKTCYKLVSLDFNKALQTPQSPRLLLECKNSKIANPMWLNNYNVALMQELGSRWKLTSYSIVDNKSTVIYEPKDGNLIDFDYSSKDDLIALTSVHNDGHHYIEILTPGGQVLSSHQIEYPNEIANLRNLYPNFMPVDDQLIFSTGRQLFTLSYEGKIRNVSLPLDEPMGSPVFHPDGKKMLMIKGRYDSDIAKISRSEITLLPTDISEVENHSIIERSIVGEENAIFQPNGELIAFESQRSGEEQVWVSDGNGARQLTNFPIDTTIYGMDWAADGKSILVNANKGLTRVFLDSRQILVPLTHTVEWLFQWDSENDTALMIIRVNGILKFVESNLESSNLRVIADKKINWAFKSEDGRLIYTDHMYRFWQPGPVEDQLIDSLEGQGSNRRFVIEDHIIYGVNDELQLWSYDLNLEAFDVIGTVPGNIDDLTDINKTDLLLTVRISAKKEVAELVLAD